MPQQKKRQPRRRSEPKLFRCAGFGNCDMVFTRSEHLARHARKHTGEKPFRCIVPNCNRMFSRFDNMIQHTHTHNRTKKKDSYNSYDGKSSPMSVPDYVPDYVPPMPTSPRSYAEHQKLYMVNNHRLLPGPRPNEKQRMYPIYCPPPSSPSIAEEGYLKYQQYYHSYSVLPQYMHQYPHPNGQHQSWAPVYYAPNTLPQYHYPTMMVSPPSTPQTPTSTISNHNNRSVPPTADCYSNNVSRKNSIHIETTSQHHHKRRLSYIELYTPIQELGSNYYCSSNNRMREDDSIVSSDDEDDDERQMSPLSMDTVCTTMDNRSRFKSHGVNITADEYEALQGFGKFCTEPIVREPMLMTRVTTSPTCSVSFPIQLPPLSRKKNISPTAVLSNNSALPSQVHAFRRQILTVQESFQRGAI